MTKRNEIVKSLDIGGSHRDIGLSQAIDAKEDYKLDLNDGGAV